MFCSKCGAQMPEDVKFCQKCGAGLSAGAAAGQQAQPVQLQPGKSPAGASGKKKKRWPMILGIVGGIFGLLIVLAAIGGKDTSGSQSQPRQNSTGVNLSQTYTNEAEGFSFRYASGWKLVGEDEYASRYGLTEDEYPLVLLANEIEDLPEENSYIVVTKADVTQDKVDRLFVDDETFASTFDSSATVQSTSVIKIDGVAARKITYVNGSGTGQQSYFYAIGRTLYRVDFGYQGESAGNNQRFFDAIMDSYKITATEAAAEAGTGAGDDRMPGNRAYIGETQNVDCGLGEFEVTLDYVELADQFVDDRAFSVEYTPKQGYVFLCAGITAKNIGKSEGTLLNPKLIFGGEYEFDTSHGSGSWLSAVPPLSPPETAVYAFELPVSAIESGDSIAIVYERYDGTEGVFFVIRQGENDSASGLGEVPAAQPAAEGNYTDYQAWCGEYDGGWLDTWLRFELYSDGTQNPECGHLTTSFRGNESTGNLYYLGGNAFQWDEETFDGVKTYYIYAIEGEGTYQLELHSLGEDTVTFTQYQQYVS